MNSKGSDLKAKNLILDKNSSCDTSIIQEKEEIDDSDTVLIHEDENGLLVIEKDPRVSKMKRQLLDKPYENLQRTRTDKFISGNKKILHQKHNSQILLEQNLRMNSIQESDYNDSPSKNEESKFRASKLSITSFIQSS